MKRNTIKKLGIIIMSAMLVATPVVTPFTTITAYAEEEPTERVNTDNLTIDIFEIYDRNQCDGVENSGTIKINEGQDLKNYSLVETNASGGNVSNNAGAIVTNEGSVSDNIQTIGTNDGTVTFNNGDININNGEVVDNLNIISTNNGTVETNIESGKIDVNNGVVNNNNATIEKNYGAVNTNGTNGIIQNNYNTIDRTGGHIGGNLNFSSMPTQWYEVKLENPTMYLKIKSEDADSIEDINDSQNTDVFVREDAEITIYSTNPNKIIDSVVNTLGIACYYEKNADGSITISGISNVYSLLTTLVDKILEPVPGSDPVSSKEPEKNDNENKQKDEVVIEVSFANPVLVAPVQPQIITPAGTVNATTVVAKNPVAAVMAAMNLQNNPVVVAQAQELSAQMETVKAAFKESVVKELATVPNQAKVGSAEYAAKQVAIVTDLTNQMTTINSLTVQSLAVIQKTGVSVATGGCTKLDADNVTLLNEILAKGIPVNLIYARNGKPVTIKIPVGVDITKFIGVDGKLDLTKLKAYAIR